MKTEKRTKEKQYSKLLQSESPSNFSEHNTRIITFNQGIKDLRINNKYMAIIVILQQFSEVLKRGIMKEV